MQFYLYGLESVQKNVSDFHCVFFRMSWFLLHLNAQYDAIWTVLLQYRVKLPISRVPVPSLVFFSFLQILTLSSNVAHSCRASCGEFTAQWIRVPLSHRKGFGEHPTPPSHTSSPGQIRYGNPTKTRFYPIISVVLLLSGPTTATLSSPFQSAISLSAPQILLHPYIAGSL